MAITSIDTSALIGAEFIQKAAFYQLFDNLNTNLAAVESAMTIYDAEFDTRTGQINDPIVLEPVANENFYEGHRPSLIKAPIDKYPNCAVGISRAVAAPGSATLDQQDEYTETLWVEIMVKSIANEREVDLRCKRMVEAVNLTVKNDPTLGGAITGLEQPSVIWGDIFPRKEKMPGAYGDEWFWQGARLEYPVRKNTTSFASQGGLFEYDQA